MNNRTTITTSERLTFKGNLKDTRYGWLRLTPAYSVHLVSEILDAHYEDEPIVLDPFCGTGTTALVCAKRGVKCVTTDINPFLIWLARVKTYAYTASDIAGFNSAASDIVEVMEGASTEPEWTPDLHQIEKWWDPLTLMALSRVMCSIKRFQKTFAPPVIDLLLIAFCRTMIERGNVSFGHQSMSFKKPSADTSLFNAEGLETVMTWQRAVSAIARAACSEIFVPSEIILCDARNLNSCLQPNSISCVVTSPPYPNRMSYIRELRPYMYWLGYLENGRAAGELDWQAIGGTWGCATSKVSKWQPEDNRLIPYAGFDTILNGIAETSKILSLYIHKYFYDMVQHSREVFSTVRSGGRIHYIVGNSKFYDVMLPVEEIFAALFEDAGFCHVTTETIRKRTSKKELYEFVVSAEKP